MMDIDHRVRVGRGVYRREMYIQYSRGAGGCGCARRGRLFSARALYYVIYLSFLSLSFTLLYNGATRRPHNPVVPAAAPVVRSDPPGVLAPSQDYKKSVFHFVLG